MKTDVTPITFEFMAIAMMMAKKADVTTVYMYIRLFFLSYLYVYIFSLFSFFILFCEIAGENAVSNPIIKLPDNLEGLNRAEHFPSQRHRWNTNEVCPFHSIAFYQSIIIFTAIDIPV